ncbi:MAG: archaeosortase/exosortase family protein [Sedimentisphaerales bacterium]|nr:archaeosortase/exosortase family protein [Sedimentisphaerales bacterium]
MSRNKKQRSRQFLRPSRRRRTNGAEKTGSSVWKSVVQTAGGWIYRHQILVFLLVFVFLMVLFYAFVVFTPFYQRDFLLSYLPFNAKVSGAILSFLGQDITVTGSSISSPRFSVRVVPGCDGIEPIALFVCAVLAFPNPFLRKLPGIIFGSFLLAVLNFIRVVSLFLIGVYFPCALNVMHIDIWQGLFIFFAVLFWIVWLRWATQNQILTERISR